MTVYINLYNISTRPAFFGLHFVYLLPLFIVVFVIVTLLEIKYEFNLCKHEILRTITAPIFNERLNGWNEREPDEINITNNCSQHIYYISIP